MFGLECRFPLVSIFDVYIVVAPLYIQFREVSGSFQLLDEFRDEWEGIGILDCSFVEFPVILARL